MVRRYAPEDFEQIKAWGKAYGANYEPDLFPPVGFIVPGIAAYFLYETPSKVCWLENLVSNPDANKEVKELAITAIITAILAESKRLGFKVAYATTDIPAVIKRATQHNAKASPNQTLLTLKIS